ncbi:MAG: hypothetical protein ACREJS_11240 [Candidatus Rokuibacteriota bacterium]
MTVWDALTWVTVAILGPGVLILCVAVARDLRRLLGGAAPPASAESAGQGAGRRRPGP